MIYLDYYRLLLNFLILFKIKEYASYLYSVLLFIIFADGWLKPDEKGGK